MGGGFRSSGSERIGSAAGRHRRCTFALPGWFDQSPWCSSAGRAARADVDQTIAKANGADRAHGTESDQSQLAPHDPAQPVRIFTPAEKTFLRI